MRIEYTQDVEVVRPLVEVWLRGSDVSQFGFHADVADILSDLSAVLDQWVSTLIVAHGDEGPVGFFSMFLCPNHLNAGSILAVEKYWFALPNTEWAGPKLYREARDWAQKNGAKHLIVSASHMMPDSHDRISRFCRAVGMKPFESSFITEVSL